MIASPAAADQSEMCLRASGLHDVMAQSEGSETLAIAVLDGPVDVGHAGLRAASLSVLAQALVDGAAGQRSDRAGVVGQRGRRRRASSSGGGAQSARSGEWARDRAAAARFTIHLRTRGRDDEEARQ